MRKVGILLLAFFFAGAGLSRAQVATFAPSEATPTPFSEDLDAAQTLSKGDAAAQYLFQWFYLFNDVLKDPVKLVFYSQRNHKIDVMILSRNQDKDPQNAKASISDVYQLMLAAGKRLQEQYGVVLTADNVVIAYDILGSGSKIAELLRFEDGKYIVE